MSEQYAALNGSSSWNSLIRLTIGIPLMENLLLYSLENSPVDLNKLLRSILVLTPMGCSVQLEGGEEFGAIIPSLFSTINHLKYSLGPSTFVVQYTHQNAPVPVSSSNSVDEATPTINSVHLDSISSWNSIDMWSCRPNALFVSRSSWIADLFAIPAPHPLELNGLTVLNIQGQYYPHEWDVSLKPHLQRSTLVNLTTLQAEAGVAQKLIHSLKMPKLHTLRCHQTQVQTVDPLLDALCHTLLRLAKRLPQLAILSLENHGGSWASLIYLISNSRGLKGGITTLKLPALPHPLILRGLVKAFKGETDVLSKASIRSIHLTLEIAKVQSYSGCNHCISRGWSCRCYEFDDGCTNHTKRKTIAITKDTPIPKHFDGED